jgi:hypothetical protein
MKTPGRILSVICLVLSGINADCQIGMPAGARQTGSSNCGGYADKAYCAPHMRRFNWIDSNGNRGSRCLVDPQCESTSKGRVNIRGHSWQNGAYDILQFADKLTIKGGVSGDGYGEFIGPYTIKITWPQVNKTFIGTVSSSLGPNMAVDKIDWNQPGNIWTRKTFP